MPWRGAHQGIDKGWQGAKPSGAKPSIASTLGESCLREACLTRYWTGHLIFLSNSEAISCKSAGRGNRAAEGEIWRSPDFLEQFWTDAQGLSQILQQK